MPAGQDILNDGSVRAGISEDLIIGSQVYTCISISMSVASNTVERADRKNLPSGAKETRGRMTGSMVLQLSSETQPRPNQFATFTSTEYGNCYITTIGTDQSQGGQTTIPCTIKQAITTNVVVT